MPEPRRMRQLLMWCGARALGEKPSFEKGDGNARLAGMAALPSPLRASTDSERDTVPAAEGLLYEIGVVKLV